MTNILTPADETYFNLIDKIDKYGDIHQDRTGVGTKRIFGTMMKFDLEQTFPIITCKKASFKNSIAELLWIIQPTGCDNINNLRKLTRKWWSPFCVDDKGWIGPMYNKQLTNYEGPTNLVKVNKRIKPIPLIHGLDFIHKDIDVTEDLDKKLTKTWRHIIDRCYNPNCKEYKYCGAQGIFLSQDWHTLSNFLRDVKLIPNWYNKYKSYADGNFSQWQLDKDYYASNCYSKETCVWLSISDNNTYRDARPFTRSDGKLYISKVKAALDLDSQYPTQISRVLNQKRNSYKGYGFKYLDTTSLYRYQLPINQIHKLIQDLKNNPYSRRHIITTYNPIQAPEGGLYTCHGNISQFMIDNKNRLHLSTTQRSMDTALGCPHNWISYAVLQTIIANICDLTPGILTYFVNDAHIYLNHLEALKNMDRCSYSHPTLKINKKDDINLYTIDDFELKDYRSGPLLKLKMAI